MSQEKDNATIKTLASRSKLLEELIIDKKTQLNSLVESLKRLEGYTVGSKELTEKIGKHVKQKKKELAELVSQQKLSKDISDFVETVLNNVVNFSKNESLESDRLFYSKQGEIVFLRQDLEKLVASKTNHDSAIKTRLEEAKKEETQQQDATVTKERSTRVRPDKDPTTRAGRAALDIAERRKKALEKQKVSEESEKKKRGRKPKA
ncbi:MAG: hypothetical protein EBU90_17150 [Proteobacteria bacterium]|nr:hypothetical protein [Pseudomonadota bacterium]